MEIISIQDPGSEVNFEHYEKLEAGNVLFIDHIPIDFSEDDYQFLMNQRQTEAGYRKNIAYRPGQDILTGAARGSDEERLRTQSFLVASSRGSRQNILPWPVSNVLAIARLRLPLVHQELIIIFREINQDVVDKKNVTRLQFLVMFEGYFRAGILN